MRYLSMLALAFFPYVAHAFSPTGLRFTHHYWELACDNTGSCRAAGYEDDDRDEDGNVKRAISVILTRKAGPGQPVSAKVRIGDYGNQPEKAKLQQTLTLAMKINDKNVGSVEVGGPSLLGDLSELQTAALVSALARRADIRLSLAGANWRLSDKGAAAVLLKMDEYQGRLGTVGALLKKGARPESSVPPAAAAPVFPAVPAAKPQPGDEHFTHTHSAALLSALRETVNENECQNLHSSPAYDPRLTAWRLSDSKMLVSASCILLGDGRQGYWVINDKPPFAPLLVAKYVHHADASAVYEIDNSGTSIDCSYSKTWRWDGTQFKLAEYSTTGMCKAQSLGTGWHMPLIVSE